MHKVTQEQRKATTIVTCVHQRTDTSEQLSSQLTLVLFGFKFRIFNIWMNYFLVVKPNLISTGCGREVED